MRTKKKVKAASQPVKSLGKLKEEILEQVRLISSGKMSTAKPLVDLGKELLRQEASVSEGDF